MMAASTTEPPVGASTWASGSQVCTGHIGTLTAKATKKAMNSAICSFIDSLAWCHCRMSKVPVLLYRYSSAISVSSEPASVYRKNLNAA
ncbi:hypothetical protein D9M72_501750 [compost metagenome]